MVETFNARSVVEGRVAFTIKSPKRVLFSAPIPLDMITAAARVCSRREAERLIAQGDVKVNGRKVAGEQLVFVKPEDEITVRNFGRVENTVDEPKLWICHKLRGELVTNNDPKRRPTVFERLKLMQAPSNLISVGRLDFNSEGLLLMTNNGYLSRALELPSSGLIRKYRVRVWSRHGEIDTPALKRLACTGLKISGVEYKPIKSKILKASNEKRNERWLDVSVHEGKYREVRQALQSIGLNVTRLIRIQYGPFLLGNLGKGDLLRIEHIPRHVMELYKREIRNDVT